MFCESCGKPVETEAASCQHCGAPLKASIPIAVEPGGLVQVTTVDQVRPWVRYWARTIDVLLFSVLVGMLMIWPPIGRAVDRVNDRLFGFVILFLWVFVEAGLLATAGTTPGKWLLKTRISSASGLPMNYSRAFVRSLNVWFRGMGIGFPLASLFTTVIAYNRLNREGNTSWDEDGGFVITHEKIGVLRTLVAIFFIAAFFALIIIVTIADRP